MVILLGPGEHTPLTNAQLVVLSCVGGHAQADPDTAPNDLPMRPLRDS
jgi:hypothetical protein